MPKMTCEMLMWFLAISIIVLFRYNGTFRLCGGGGGGEYGKSTRSGTPKEAKSNEDLVNCKSYL